jgi:molybdopterin converting factor small subunit
MALVRVTVPGMLATLVSGERTFDVEGSTVAEVLDATFTRHPPLRVHILDELNGVRPHVLLFRNDLVVRDLSAEVTEADTFTILQAVSGG